VVAGDDDVTRSWSRGIAGQRTRRATTVYLRKISDRCDAPCLPAVRRAPGKWGPYDIRATGEPMKAPRLLIALSLMAAVTLLAGSPMRAKALETAEAGPSAGLAVPGYGPGVAGNATIGPTTPVCSPDAPCTEPLANAHIVIVDANARTFPRPVVARTMTNSQGNFLVSVPNGEYVVHVRTPDALPVCSDVRVTVGARLFTLVALECDSGIR
jgi:hypothetical protein